MAAPLTDAELAIAQAKHAAQVCDLVMGSIVAPRLPKARTPDDVYCVEDECCDLHCSYVVTDYGSDDTAPKAEVIAVQADFGGRTWVDIPLSALKGSKLLELEQLCADDVQEKEYDRLRAEGKL
jgi:hypothetical protein